MALPPRTHRTLAGVYLQQALDAVRAAGSSDGLYTSPHARRMLQAPARDTRDGALRGLALRQQTEHCRTAILFTALACEAYVNEYLTNQLGERDFKAIDRLPTADKLIVGCKLAGGPTYDRGQGEGQIIGELFSIRNRLVHPRPGIGRYPHSAEYPKRDDTFNPPTAVKHLVAVARVGYTLIETAFHDPQQRDTPSFEIVSGEKYLRGIAAEIDWSVPPPSQAALPDLVELIRDSLRGERRSH